jgi:hypothetical protein
VPNELLAGLKKRVTDEKRPVGERITFAIQVVKQDPTDQGAAKLLKEQLVYVPDYGPSFRPQPQPPPDEVIPAVLGPAACPKSWPFSSPPHLPRVQPYYSNGEVYPRFQPDELLPVVAGPAACPKAWRFSSPRYAPQVRAGVIPAFESAGGVPQLVEWLGHEDGRVVEQAFTSLGRVGSDAKAAKERVKELLKHADPAVRYLAAETLFAIDPTDKAVLPVLLELLTGKEVRWRYGRAANPPRWLGWQGAAAEWDPVPAVRAAAEIVFDLDPEAAVKADVYRLVFPRSPR